MDALRKFFTISAEWAQNGDLQRVSIGGFYLWVLPSCLVLAAAWLIAR
jgi:hypothetical protein